MTWVTGKPLTYSNWEELQPNNQDGVEHFLALVLDRDGKWADQPDRSTQLKPGFVCQWESMTTSRPTPIATPQSSFGGTYAGLAKAIALRKDVVLNLRWCPAGTFVMGSPAGENFRLETEDDRAGVGGKPVRVSLSRGFWLAETEVTQSQWMHVMGSSPWTAMDEVMEGPDYPASYISHGDTSAGGIQPDSALAFCVKLTELERTAGRLPADWAYRLPTSAQWEYACRAGLRTAYSFGNEFGRSGEYAWTLSNTLQIGQRYAHRVGQKRANQWGFRDMHGNMMEWCADRSDGVGGGTLPLQGGLDPAGPAAGSYRVARGGGWYDNVANCRSSSADGRVPNDRRRSLGFRPVAIQVR